MKKILLITLLVLAVSAMGPLAVLAGEHQVGPPVVHSRDLDRMKALAGVWKGNADRGQGMEQLRVTYELTSAGNAIVERFAAGMPHEMVTVHPDFNGRLTMTHYCSLGNQPHRELTNPGESTLKLVLSEKTRALSP